MASGEEASLRCRICKGEPDVDPAPVVLGGEALGAVHLVPNVVVTSS